MSTNNDYLNDLKAELSSYGKQLSKIQSEFKGKAVPHAEKAQKSLKAVLDEATESYSKLKDASEKEWEPLKKISVKAFENLKSSFSDVVEASSEKGEEYKKKVEAYSEEQAERISEYIGQNPLKSILFALGAGFIIGKITK
ncbi:MAG: hypothetical protein B7Y25_04695 [Alphaproteobacteria bacterium 16-39-46]|nr:MAG: hypothetical protein B7Y25_04695 [Alphaproteobacteria bacterium 16-39-46]OZA42896.1 MAG: hypothetical protein B7X84_04520 [Alphaproteobacteria bacterium 17-39-52]HQS84239.1 hypothetical protein [Alphaproteobacteria bacterium]HQS94058.1 hypothetical protein [Alphaproteobacteria bacterium]